MPERHTLAETEKAMLSHVDGLPVDLPAAHAISSLYRAANSVRNHITNTVLRERDLTWTGYVLLWVTWIWDGIETRHAAEAAGISKATVTGVVKTLQSRGWIIRAVDDADRRRVHLRLTPAGLALMEEVYPAFNAVESEVVSGLSPRGVADLTRSLRTIVTGLESPAADPSSPAADSA
jgi:DNA-binding MarR family transcriptional regulator